MESGEAKCSSGHESLLYLTSNAPTGPEQRGRLPASPAAAAMPYLALCAMALLLPGSRAAWMNTPGSAPHPPARRQLHPSGGGPLFPMATPGTRRPWEAVPDPAGSGVGSDARPQPGQPRALRVAGSPSEEAHGWERGGWRLPKRAPRGGRLTSPLLKPAGWAAVPASRRFSVWAVPLVPPPGAPEEPVEVTSEQIASRRVCRAGREHARAGGGRAAGTGGCAAEPESVPRAEA